MKKNNPKTADCAIDPNNTKDLLEKQLARTDLSEESKSEYRFFLSLYEKAINPFDEFFISLIT